MSVRLQPTKLQPCVLGVLAVCAARARERASERARERARARAREGERERDVMREPFYD